jgi:hypothetical protein
MFPFNLIANIGKGIGETVGVLVAAVLVTILTSILLVWLQGNVEVFRNIFTPWIAGFSAAFFVEVLVFVLTLFSSKD